ncbi:hypothetical protein Pen01_65930 [Phytomonospora endophytica]|nr:hypothetical protein Pen01_65930 [Phytomonospora endophytica]
MGTERAASRYGADTGLVGGPQRSTISTHTPHDEKRRPFSFVAKRTAPASNPRPSPFRAEGSFCEVHFARRDPVSFVTAARDLSRVTHPRHTSAHISATHAVGCRGCGGDLGCGCVGVKHDPTAPFGVVGS